MPTLDDFIPEPRLCELDSIEVGAAAAGAFAVARDFDLARVPLASALFGLRTLAERITHGGDVFARPSLRVADIGRVGPGFQVLADLPDRLIVGAIGRFWESEIAFADVLSASFMSYDQAGWGKVAWELRCEPSETTLGSRITVELRLTTTDGEAWRKLRWYFRVIGPFSRFFRRSALSLLAREIGTPEHLESKRPLAGDSFIATPKVQVTHAITIHAAPHAVWPWLVQMGCRRAGWYSHDQLDNGGILSETRIVPELQHLAVGDVLPATPTGSDGFTVLAIEELHSLVLRGLFAKLACACGMRTYSA